MPPPLVDFGGDGPLLHFAVANGFPHPVYTPLLQPLTAAHRVVTLPPRALWPGEQPPAALIDWRDGTARDLLEGLRAHDLRDVVLVGHSFGGIASMLVALEEPERFRALVLLDPTILTPDLLEMLAYARREGISEQIPLAARALRRQRDFASVDEAFIYFRGKTLFDDWDDDAVRRYAALGTYPTAEGGVRLIWTPEWEAYVFMTGYLDTWRDLPRLRGLLPLLIVRGGTSDTFTAESAAKVRAMLPEAEYVEVAGQGHLFPLSQPAVTAQLVAAFLARLP